MTAKKLGRPTISPKNTKLTVRVDDETLQILERYCKKENILDEASWYNEVMKYEAEVLKKRGN